MSNEQVAEVPVEGVAQSVETEIQNDWRDSIPEDIRGHRSLSHITDVGALAKSYVHAQSMIGADKVVIPGKHSTPEEWNEVFAKMGRPETPDGYEINTSGNGTIPEMADWYRQTAHELGLNNRQANELFERYNQFADQMNAAIQVDPQQYQAQTEAMLRSEYGEAFDERIENANALVAQFAGADATEALLADGTRLGDNPAFIKFTMDISQFISERMGEDQLEGMKVSGGRTTADAIQELSEVQAKGTPYWDNRHPDHDRYVQKAAELNRLIHDG